LQQRRAAKIARVPQQQCLGDAKLTSELTNNWSAANMIVHL